MHVYVIVGENKQMKNISARAVYSTRTAAEAHLADPERSWFDDRAVVTGPFVVDKEIPRGT